MLTIVFNIMWFVINEVFNGLIALSTSAYMSHTQKCVFCPAALCGGGEDSSPVSQ